MQLHSKSQPSSPVNTQPMFYLTLTTFSRTNPLPLRYISAFALSFKSFLARQTEQQRHLALVPLLIDTDRCQNDRIFVCLLCGTNLKEEKTNPQQGIIPKFALSSDRNGISVYRAALPPSSPTQSKGHRQDGDRCI